MVTPKKNKLAIQWKRPKRITAAQTDLVYQPQDLFEPLATTVRLKYYCEATRGQEQELMEHARHSEGGHLIESILACKKDGLCRVDGSRWVWIFLGTSTQHIWRCTYSAGKTLQAVNGFCGPRFMNICKGSVKLIKLFLEKKKRKWCIWLHNTCAVHVNLRSV